MSNTPQVRAGGNVNVSTFVIVNSSASDTVVAASGTSTPIFGIAQEWTNTSPIPGASTSLAAASGDPLKVYMAGEICYLTAGTAGWTAGDLLTSNASGQGLTASAGNYVGAQALSTVTNGAQGAVVVRFGKA